MTYNKNTAKPPTRISRRRFSASLAMLPLASGCAFLSSTNNPKHYTPSGLPLRRVLVSADRVIRTVTGLRPYRRTGFVVRAETLGDKTLVHNYGHGGGGITLSWGTSHLAMELAEQTGRKCCAVIGCGAVGLSSARIMQRRGWDVAIYARDLPPDTTSNIAGAQWSPASVFDRESVAPAFYEQLGVALRHSYRYFQGMVGERYGIRWVSNYMLSDGPFRQDDVQTRYAELYPELRPLNPDQHPFRPQYARHFNTMFIEPPVYLPAVMRDYYVAGGRISIREFRDPAELLELPEPVLINCTGLGSRELFGDRELIPVKGQLSVLLPQSDIDYLMIYDGIYMFPRKDGVLLGGTFEKNEWSLTPNPDESVRILRAHEAFFRNMEDPWGRT